MTTPTLRRPAASSRALRLDFPPCASPPTPLRVLARSDDVWTLVAARGREIVCVKQAARPGAVVAARELLGAEAHVLARIGGGAASTPRLLDTGTTPGGLPFVVLEHHDGAPLAALLPSLDLPPADVAPRSPAQAPVQAHVHGHDQARAPRPTGTLLVAVLRGVLAALARVAERLPGLVHRDVTPSNVLLGLDGRVLLADFGIALFPGRARRTSPRAVRGTPDFLAPEQLRGEALDARTDLYALGLTAYVVAAGRWPFAGRTVDERAATKLAGAALPLEAVRRDLDPALLAWIARAMARRPRERFGCAEEAMGALPLHTVTDLASSVHSATLGARARRRALTEVMPRDERWGQPVESLAAYSGTSPSTSPRAACPDIVCHAKKLTR